MDGMTSRGRSGGGGGAPLEASGRWAHAFSDAEQSDPGPPGYNNWNSTKIGNPFKSPGPASGIWMVGGTNYMEGALPGDQHKGESETVDIAGRWDQPCFSDIFGRMTS